MYQPLLHVYIVHNIRDTKLASGLIGVLFRGRITRSRDARLKRANGLPTIEKKKKNPHPSWGYYTCGTIVIFPHVHSFVFFLEIIINKKKKINKGLQTFSVGNIKKKKGFRYVLSSGKKRKTFPELTTTITEKKKKYLQQTFDLTIGFKYSNTFDNRIKTTHSNPLTIELHFPRLVVNLSSLALTRLKLTQLLAG